MFCTFFWGKQKSSSQWLYSYKIELPHQFVQWRELCAFKIHAADRTDYTSNVEHSLSLAWFCFSHLTYGYYELEDRHTLESYGIGEGATIRLSPDNAESGKAYCIYIQRTEEELFPVWVKASDTIGSLKTRLMNSIEFDGLWKGQHLIFNQQQLEDGYKFSDYNIQESTIIHFRWEMVFLISVTATLD